MSYCPAVAFGTPILLLSVDKLDFALSWFGRSWSCTTLVLCASRFLVKTLVFLVYGSTVVFFALFAFQHRAVALLMSLLATIVAPFFGLRPLGGLDKGVDTAVVP